MTRDPAPLAVTAAEAAALFTPLFGGVSKILLAVSGGADSVALLVLAAEWARSSPAAPALGVATVDHGLRAEAAGEAAVVAELAERLGLPHARLATPLPHGAGVEATARDLRYAALAAHARATGAEAFATAHTLDDQAETVLMRLSAGSGPAGLAAMREKIGREDGLLHLRPFLGVAKAQLVASLLERGVGWAEDAMNADPVYARARLRAGRAALEREGLTADRLGVLAARMARIEDALAAWVEEAASAHLAAGGGRATIAPAAAALPPELRLRLLARAVAAAGGSRVRLDRLERLLGRIVQEPSGVATLAGARVAWGAEGRVKVTRAPPRKDGRRRP